MAQQINNNNETEIEHRSLDNGDHVSLFLFTLLWLIFADVILTIV